MSLGLTEELHARLTARRACRYCRETFKIHIEIAGTLYAIATTAELKFSDELDDQGWRAGACPKCAEENSQRLDAEDRADDHRDMEGEQ